MKTETPLTYKFHKYAELYPLASDKELQDLTEDIEKHGLANPIVLYNGEIIDGRNRYIACERANFSPDFQDWHDLVNVGDAAYNAENENHLLCWVISQNSLRRHLSTSQLAMVAAKVAEVFKENAKKRQLAGQNNKAGAAVKAKLPELKSTGQVRDEAAKAVGGVSGRSVQDAVKVLKASPELVEQISAGKITVNQAMKQLKNPTPVNPSKIDPQVVAAGIPATPAKVLIEKILVFVSTAVKHLNEQDKKLVYETLAKEFNRV